MKEWQELLNYIDYYVYVEEEEAIIIKHGTKADAAFAEYAKGLEILIGEYVSDSAISQLDKDNNVAKWKFDIALDCIRRMNEEDRKYIRKHMHTAEYHMGYAMGIRNRYVHPAKKHKYFMADGVSGGVMVLIFSILSPIYDYRNEDITDFYDDFATSKLIEMYADSFPEIFDEIIDDLSNDKNIYGNAAEAIEALKEKLRNSLGEEEFIRILKEAVIYYEKNGLTSDRDDWYWEINFLSCKAILYPIQAKQMNILRRMHFFEEVERYAIKSVEECRKYIDENIGLREDYADFMARCAWEVYNPVKTGKWRELSLYSLDIDILTKSELEQKGINNLGDLCKYSVEQLAKIPEVGTKGAIKIKTELESMGVTLGTSGVFDREEELEKELPFK